MVPFVTNLGAAAATTSTPAITVGPPATWAANGYVASVTEPTPFVMPVVSDAAGDTFTYAITGANSAECVVAIDAQSFTYEHAGTCVVVITAARTDDDGDADAVGKTNPSSCQENVSGNLRAHLRGQRLAHLSRSRTASSTDCTNTTLSTTLTLSVLDQSRSIVVGAPATGSNGVYAVSVTAPTIFSMPPVSDGVAGDTFTYALTGTNSAGCALASDASTFTYQRVGSCTVTITSSATSSDTDGDASEGVSSASATLGVNVLAHSQTISLASTSVRYRATVLLQATGFLGTGTISYALVGGSASGCAIDAANELSATPSGTCLVQAHIAADDTYAAATSTTATITFAPAPVVTPPPTPPPAPPVTTTTAPPVTTTTAPPVTTTTAPPVTTATQPAPVIKSQSLSLASGRLSVDQSWRLQATGYRGTGTLSYALVGGSARGCAINSSHQLHANLAGTCRVQAHIAADGTYAAATSNVATIDFTVLDQSITLASGHVKFGGAWPLQAQGYQGDGVVSYHLVGGSAKGCAMNAGHVLTAASAGTCLASASIGATGTYAAASSRVATITFDPAPVLPTLVIKNSAVAAPPRPKLPPTVSMSVASFAEGSYLLSPALNAQINAIAAKVGAKKYHVVDLTGYTDNVFTPAFNRALNAQRTRAVRARLLADLAARHVKGVRVIVVVNPKRYVFASRSNVTPTGRAFNRRVVATIFAL